VTLRTLRDLGEPEPPVLPPVEAILEYAIFEAGSAVDLVARVRVAIAEDWEPLGQPMTAPTPVETVWYQAMIRERS